MKKLLLFISLLGCIAATAKKKDPPAPAKPADKKVTIAEKIKTCKKYPGLFPLYQDTVNGNVYMLVNRQQLDKQFIYFACTENGVVNAGHFKGSFRDNKVFTIKKYFDRVEFITVNTEFYFDPSSELSRSANANISNATLVSQKPVAEDADKGDMLLDANTIFLTEAFHQVKPSPSPVPGSPAPLLGNLSKDKTKYVKLRNYEQNTDIIVEYVFDNAAASAAPRGREVTDSRAVSIILQHTLIQAPETPMQTRRDDPRVGYFSEEVDDMTTTNSINYRDLIHRWRLEKKDKNAALSEPVKPITWWIENTTPKEFRETIKAAGLQWNLAFEKAGFKNAVEIKEQPDNADWDAGDIRYNVLRWTSSPQPPFGGYGPSFVDPRTGEILGADIMLEYIFITNRILQERLYDAGIATNEIQQPADQHFCNVEDAMHMGTLFGLSVLEARGLSDLEKRDYIKQSLYYLVLHEMGHTMGLMHNMRASQLWSPQQAHNKTLTQKYGLTASVMDYPSPNVATDRTKQGDYFTTTPGPYDLWAIEYAYTEALDDAAKEEERLTGILSRSTDSTLIFGNDADDMRAPGKAIDPRVNVNDMSNDAITYSADRLKLVNQLMPKIKDKYTRPGSSYQDVRQAYALLMGELVSNTTTISRYIGGVYTDRAFAGQQTNTKPLVPVDYKDQKRAMQALSTYLFSPNAFNIPADIYNYTQIQRRGFNFFANTEDLKIHDRAIAAQQNVIAHLLHQNTLKRITDTRLYGNRYSALEMMGDLTAACFREDIAGSPNTFRQNLQLDYTTRLAAIANTKTANGYDMVARSAALAQLKNIKKMIAVPGGNAEAAAHKDHLGLIIDRALAKE